LALWRDNAGVGGIRGAAVFVGRWYELSVLREAWISVGGGQPCWVLAGGEAGIGKTRLVTEFADEVSAEGARVAIGSCPPVAPGLVPFAPVVEVLRELGPSVAQGLARGSAEAIARLLEVELPAGRSGMPGEADRARLLAAVRAVLERKCSGAPLLVVFEDLHWADASTREVLAFLASQPPRGRVMFVGTYRDDQRSEGQRVWSLVDRLSRLGARRLDLPRLRRADLEGLLDGLLGHRPGGTMVDAVLSRSEGNPFLVEELVAAGALSGVLPEGLRNLLLARTMDLPEAARQVVGLAAVAGLAVDGELLEEVWRAAYGPSAALPGALRRAVAAGVLICVAGQRRYAFRHALVREAVYDDMLPVDRSRWHRELACCLARAPAGGQGPGYAARAAWTAHHWLAAGHREQALAACLVAGQAAEQTLAFGEAARHYRVAARLWHELGAGPADASSWTLSQVFEHAAQVSYLPGNPQRAIAGASRAIELSDSGLEPARAGLLHERRGRYRWSAGAPCDETGRDFATAVELVPDGPAPARARVLLLAAWRGERAAVERDMAQIDAILARGGHADMRSRVAVAAAEAAIWFRAYATASRYVLEAADTDAGTDDLHMRPHVAAVGLRLAAEWPAVEPATAPARQALARRMLALVSDPGCRKAPGYQAHAYLRTAEAEASRLSGPGDPALWRAAVQAWEQIPAPHRIAHAKLRLAEALLACRGQRHQAQAELAAAQEAAVRLGARALAEEAGSLAIRARLEPGAARQPEPADRFGLTGREREVLGLVCAGAASRQIAERLFISPKTVGLHVSHILAKLGVATRGEAAALTHRLERAAPAPLTAAGDGSRPDSG